MSGWRIVTRALYELGGSGTTRDVARHLGRYDWLDLSSILSSCRGVGTLTSSAVGVGSNSDTPCTWTLTPVGIGWCEGRYVAVTVRPGGRHWAATWIESLPRGLTL
jgi:hypothetical protein